MFLGLDKPEQLYYICVITNNVTTDNMGEALMKWLKMRKAPSVKEEALLNLMVASHIYQSLLEKIISEFGITRVQYNVLRILKGVYPDGHPRCEIANRMIESSPDITRLIDRLEKQKLVERDRSNSDRRMSYAKITKKGIELLDKVQPSLENVIKDTTKELTDSECKTLSELLEKLYRDKI